MNKIICFILLSLRLCSVQFANGQSADSSINYIPKHYFSFSLFTGAGLVITGSNNGIFAAHFPYTVVDTSGIPRNMNFNAQNIKLYAPVFLLYCPLWAEYGTINYFIRGGVIFRLGNGVSSSNLSAGYGRNFYIDLGKHRHNNIAERSLVLKPSLNLDFNYGANLAQIGTIDNTNKNIYLLGNKAGPTYTISTKSGSYTVQARDLDIYYQQNELAIQPGLTLSNNPLKHHFLWQMGLSYDLPVYDKAGIQLYQNHYNALNNLLIPLQNVAATFNGKSIVSPPRSFSSFVLNFTFFLNGIQPKKINGRKHSTK